MLILHTFFKVDRSKVYCGIFAFSGLKNLSPEQMRLALEKFKILGMFNESRGGQGAGIYANGSILKCGTKYKTFPELIANNLVATTSNDHVYIGHCRKASRGITSIENSHPYEIENNLIGVHNGTIENIDALVKKYEIDSKFGTTDSEKLYQIIHASGVSVLSEYKGFAALMWTNRNQKNVIHAFHGESRNYKNGNLVEERPLYFMKTSTGIYLSSLELSLWAIRETDDQEPEVLPTNVVFKIMNGRFTKVKENIEREDANVWSPTTTTYSSHNRPSNQGAPAFGGDCDEYEDYLGGCGVESWQKYNERINNRDKQLSIPLPGNQGCIVRPPSDNTDKMIHLRETMPFAIIDALRSNITPTKIYYWKGRYYMGSAKKCNGALFITQKGHICSEDNIIVGATEYWFYKGILLSSKQAHDDLMGDIRDNKIPIDKPEANFAAFLTKYTDYPITNGLDEAKLLNESLRFLWYNRAQGFGKRMTLKTFTPRWSGRNYIFKDGYLVDIKTSNKKKDSNTIFKSQEESSAFMKELIALKKKAATEDAVETPFQEDIAKDIFLDRKYQSVAEIKGIIPQNYLTVFYYRAEEMLKKFHPLDPDAEEVREELDRILVKAITTRITLREAFEDNLQDRILDKSLILLNQIDNIWGNEPASTFHVEVDDDGVDLPGFSVIRGINQDYFQKSIAETIRNLEIEEENRYTSYQDLIEQDNIVYKPEDEDEEEDLEKAVDDLRDANEIVESMVDSMEELNSRIESLSENECNFAKQVTGIVARALSSLKYNLADAARENTSTSTYNKIQRININETL